MQWLKDKQGLIAQNPKLVNKKKLKEELTINLKNKRK